MTILKAALRALLLALVLTGVPVAAHAADPFVPVPSDPPRMVAAWEAWDATGVDDYTITVDRSCFCPPDPATQTVVRNGEVRRVTKGDRRLAERRGYTMDRVYAMIRDANKTADHVEVTYTPRGVPKSINIDWIELAADDESYYTVSLTRL